MLELFKFIFSSFWVYAGTWFLIVSILSLVAYAFHNDCDCEGKKNARQDY